MIGHSLQSVAAALGGIVSGNQVLAPGPNHSDKDRSLSVKIDSGAPDGFIVNSFAEDDPRICKDYVRSKLGMPAWHPRPKASQIANTRAPDSKSGAAEYIYKKADGTPYLRVVRPGFYQSHWNGTAWVSGAPKGPKIPYRLPEILSAEHDDVFIVEGEKDADTLADLGFVATTNSCGAGKWTPDLNQYLAGKNVYILPDNDEPGAAHARQVAAHLIGIAREIRIVNLPDLPAKEDVTYWMRHGGDAGKLIDLCRAAKSITASDDPVHKPAAVRPRSNDIVTEDSAATQFVELHSKDLRFCHSSGAWYRWNAAFWSKDQTGIAFQWARELARQLAEDQDERKRYITNKTSFASGVERFAKVDPQVAVTIDYWDADPWLLGTPGGTVNLRTGELNDPNRDDGITKSTSVAPAGTADCPRWLRFLEETTGNDKELIRFLQQWCGYSLTGLTREHALVFVYGPGGNGKILRHYAATAAMDTFTASHADKHPTDLAMLRGARLVTASETEEGRAWAESRIKQMTGGDRISARFMRQDFFEFVPQFKLTIIGNHKPVLHNVDEAARRRFNIVPFVLQPAEPDRQLEQRLTAEAPAILPMDDRGLPGLASPRPLQAGQREGGDRGLLQRPRPDGAMDRGPMRNPDGRAASMG